MKGMAVGALALGLLATAATSGTTEAHPLTPVRYVTLGLLSAVTSTADPECGTQHGVNEINEGGGGSLQPFRIPEGQVLVLTDLEYFTSSSDPTVLLLSFSTLSGVGTEALLRVAARPLDDDRAYGETHLTSGRLIGSKFCVQYVPPPPSAPRTSDIYFHGYLASTSE